MTGSAPLILSADIGGTNTRLALLDGTVLRTASVERFENAGADHLDDILGQYVASTGVQPDAVSLALAGPVEGDTGTLTNLDWTVTTDGAAMACGGARAILLNDLQAQGCALPYVAPDAIQCLVPGAPPQKDAACLMIGVGTGMNISPVHYVNGTTFVPPAEAGHTNFAPQDDGLRALQQWLAARLGHVASEDILSGRGLENTYTHVTGITLKAQQIMTLCAQGDADARKAAGLVIRALGYFASDMALTHLPRGGIFLIGGVARALAPYAQDEGFTACFTDKGRFSNYVAEIPVYVLSDDYAALTGAASYAMERLF